MLRRIALALICLGLLFYALPARAQGVECLRDPWRKGADFLWAKSPELRQYFAANQSLIEEVTAEACETFKLVGNIGFEIETAEPIFDEKTNLNVAVTLIVVSELFEIDNPAMLIAALQIRHARAAVRPIMLPPPPPVPPPAPPIAKKRGTATMASTRR